MIILVILICRIFVLENAPNSGMLVQLCAMTTSCQIAMKTLHVSRIVTERRFIAHMVI